MEAPPEEDTILEELDEILDDRFVDLELIMALEEEDIVAATLTFDLTTDTHARTGTALLFNVSNSVF